MSQFTILEKGYRLIETQFGDEVVHFKATELASGDVVQIRALTDRSGRSPARAQQFQVDAERLASVAHPLVMRARFVAPGVYDQHAYLITESVDTTLADLISSGSPASEERLRAVTGLIRLLQGLEDCRLTAGALDPAAIAIDAGNATFRLMSLPGVRSSASDGHETFSAPEWRQGAEVDSRSDQYPVGLIICRLYLSSEQFGHLTDTIEAHEPPPPLSDLTPDCPSGLASVVGRMLATKPEERYATADDILHAVEAALAGGTLPLRDTTVRSDEQPDLTAPRAISPVTEPRGHSSVIPEPIHGRRGSQPRGRRVSHLVWYLTLIAVVAGAGYGYHHRQQIRLASLEIERIGGAREAALQHPAIAFAAVAMDEAEQARAASLAAMEQGDHKTARAMALAAIERYRLAIEAGETRKVRERRRIAREAESQMEALLTALGGQSETNAPGYDSANEALEGARAAIADERWSDAADGFALAKVEFEQAHVAANQAASTAVYEEASRARQEAMTAGASEATAFTEAERLLQESRTMLAERYFEAGTEKAELALTGFGAAGQQHLAAKQRAQAQSSHRRLLEANISLERTELDTVRSAMAQAQQLFDEGKYELAQSAFESAQSEMNRLMDEALMATVEESRSLVEQRRHEALSAGGQETSHFHLAEEARTQAEALASQDGGGAEIKQLRLAAAEYLLAVSHSKALARQRLAERAQTTALRSGVTLNETDVGVLEQQEAEATTALQRHEHERAARLFDSVASGFSTLVENRWRHLAQESRSQSSRSRASADSETDPALWEVGVRQFDAAEREWQAQSYETARSGFDSATEAFRRIGALAEMKSVKSEMEIALAHALENGASAQDEAVTQGRERVESGQQAFDDGNFDSAREDYQEAATLFAKAATRALRGSAEQAAERVSSLKSSLDAGDTGRLHAAADTSYREAQKLLVLGRFEQALEMFEQAQAQYRQTERQHLAADARDRSVALRDAVQVAGVDSDSPAMVDAGRLFDAAEVMFAAEDFEHAIESYRASAVLLRTANEENANRQVEQIRERVLAVRATVPDVELSELAARADEEVRQGDAHLQSLRYEEAETSFVTAGKHYRRAILEGQARVARTRARDDYDAALGEGVEATDPYLVAGLGELENAHEYEDTGRFEQALAAFASASERFETARITVDQLVRKFNGGSTPEEIETAFELCSRSSPDCRRDWFDDEGERAARLRPYVIDDHEVTNEEFAEFIRVRDYRTESENRGYSNRSLGYGPVQAPGYSWRTPTGGASSHLRFPTHPVVHVTQNDAAAYCGWAGGRLPNEDEWEYAARGDQRRIYPWGDQWLQDNVRWAGDPADGPMAVRSFPEGATPSGLYDLSGNVREWTASRAVGGIIVKGGSWIERQPSGLRAAARDVRDGADSSTDIGFRCAWDLDAWPAGG